MSFITLLALPLELELHTPTMNAIVFRIIFIAILLEKLCALIAAADLMMFSLITVIFAVQRLLLALVSMQAIGTLTMKGLEEHETSAAVETVGVLMFQRAVRASVALC